MLMMGDADAFDPAHYVEIFKLLGGGLRDPGMDNAQRPIHRLAIVPLANHYDILESTLVGTFASDFLDA